MIRMLTLLLACQLVGEVTARAFDLPIPGPVIGMALLFAGLMLRGLPETLESTAGGLLKHLSLLFVPAGTGVMTHLTLLKDEWLPITVALIASTLITIVVTAWIMQLLNKSEAETEAES